MSWHIEPSVLQRYQTGVVDRVMAASLEGHLTACRDCRSQLEVDEGWLERSWQAVTERVEPARPSFVERFLTFLGAPPHVARVMALTPSLRLSWLLAVTVSLLFAGLASRVVQPGGFDLFLVLAPLVPVAGVAVAYGRHVDPAHEITVAAPVDPLRLLLLRAAIVTSFAVSLSLLIDLSMPTPLGTGLWILPAFALTLLTLALGTRLSMWLAGASSSATWLVVLTLIEARHLGASTALFGGMAQVGFIAVTGVAALVLWRHADAYRRGDER